MISWLRWRWKWAWIRHRRRSLEAHLYCSGALGPWQRVKEENDLLGVWRSGKK